MRPAAVVLGWAGFNAVLATIMFAYGESAEFIGLYGLAVLATVAIGLVVWFVARRPAPTRQRLPAGSQSAGLLALAAILFGLGFVYTHLLSYLALFPLLGAAFAFHRERLPAGVVPVRTEVRSSPVEPPREHPRLGRVARAATLGGVVARVLSSLRPGRRRS